MTALHRPIAPARPEINDLSLVLVWGNCQAGAIANMIEPSVVSGTLDIVRLPPVFEMDQATLDHVKHDLMPRTRFLISQPVRDEYSIPGCGTKQLASLMPDGAQLLTFPITYDTSAFPYQVNAHRGNDARVQAPLTHYHDLRAIVAAERSLDVTRALEWWPTPTSSMVRSNAEHSRIELQRREQDLDVHSSDLLTGPAMHTMTHPTNATLAAVARRIASAMDLPASVVSPERELLGDQRAPLEPSVVEALGWPPSVIRKNWRVAGRDLSLREVLEAQLTFYAANPDVVVDTRRRFADRLDLLEL